jgi:hypothetical protein
MWKIIILIVLNLSCYQTNKTIIVVDSSDKYEFRLNNKDGKLIHLLNNIDKTIEVSREIVFYLNDESFSNFHIYEEAVGTSQNLIFKHSDSQTFITEVYDKSALGDSLILNSINLKMLTGKVKGIDKKEYLIKVTSIKY